MARGRSSTKDRLGVAGVGGVVALLNFKAIATNKKGLFRLFPLMFRTPAPVLNFIIGINPVNR
eukprot:2893085-Lingulodinium_polyedra.AAC.1